MKWIAASLATVLVVGCTAQDPPVTTRAGAPAHSVVDAGPRVQPSGSVFGSYLAGRLARSERDHETAADFFNHALSVDPANKILQRRTFILMLADGRVGEALRLARQVRAASPTDDMANLVLALDAFRSNKFAEAREILDRARGRGFMRLLGGLLVAWSYAGENDFDASIAALEGLRDTAAFDLFRVFHQALIYDLADRFEDANKAYESTMATGARDAVRVTMAYGSYLERTDRVEEARTIYETYADRVASNQVTASALARLGKLLPPRAVPDAVAGAAETLYSAASVLAQDKSRDTAVIYLQLALFARPDYPIAQTLLADLSELDRRWEQAIAIYQTIDPTSEYGWNARIRIAWALDKLARHEQAIALLRRMARERADATDALITLADILRAQKRYREAAHEYDQAIGRLVDVKARHWSLFYARGIAYERSQRWRLAEADFVEALRLKPDQPLVLNYLGYSWADQGIKLDRAVEMIEKAVALRPNDGYIVDSLGWVLFRFRRYEEAVEQLERAAELRPEDPVINDHLGDALWQVGRRVEARFQWRRALSLEPEAQLIPVIKNKLEVGLVPDVSGDQHFGQDS